MNNFLYYNLTLHNPDVFSRLDSSFNEKKINTLLPKNIAIIRAVAVLAFTSLAALQLSTTIFCWPVIVIGVAFAGWTIYFNFFSKDPMMEAFYQIVGGKDHFEDLPEIDLVQAPGEKISDIIYKLEWDNLDQRIYRSKTLDGRNIIIVRGFEEKNQIKGVLTFIEKVGPEDLHISTLPDLAAAVVHAVLKPFTGNTFTRTFGPSITKSGDDVLESHFRGFYSFILTDTVNDLSTQING